MVTRPCLCGLDRWPGRLCGFTDKAADGAPRWTTGLVSPGQVGVPPAPDSLTLTAGRATGEIQGQSPGLSVRDGQHNRRMTFSIAARCTRTGQFAAAVTSSSPAVAARCAFARAGVGAVTTQNITDPRLGPALLDALAEGLGAEAALAQVLAKAASPAYRQLTVLDAAGRTAA